MLTDPRLSVERAADPPLVDAATIAGPPELLVAWGPCEADAP